MDTPEDILKIQASKLNEVKKLYDEVMTCRNIDSDISDESLELRKKAQQCQCDLQSIMDVTLRAFMNIKNIRKIEYSDGTRKEISLNDKNRRAYSYECCYSILEYNNAKIKQNSEQDVVLQNVDFCCFITNGEDGNLPKHVGVTTELNRVARIHENLRRVIIESGVDLEEDIKAIEPDISFEYDSFHDYVNEYDDTQTRYILIAESMHDIADDLINSFCKIPWAAIIDTDYYSHCGGLKSFLDAHDIGSEIEYDSICDPSNAIRNRNRIPVYLNLKSKQTTKCESYRINSPSNIKRKCGQDVDRRYLGDKNVANKLISLLHGDGYSGVVIVVLGNLTNRIKNFCKQITQAFEYDESSVLICGEADENSIYELKNDSAEVHQFQSNVYDVLSTIHKYRDSLPERDDSFNVYEGEIVVLHDGNRYIIPKNEAERINKYFEIIPFQNNESITTNNINEFLHGYTANWVAINSGNILPLKDIKECVELIKKNKMRPCHLYHTAGAGGTTLGRQIAWAMHKSMPSFRLKSCVETDMCEVVLQLRTIHEMLGKDESFFLLIDEDDFSSDMMMCIESTLKGLGLNFYMLFVKRTTTVERKLADTKTTIILKLLDDDHQNAIQSSCQAYMDARGEISLFWARKEKLSLFKKKSPLLINLYLLEEFQLEKHVAKFLTEIAVDNSVGNTVIEAVAIIAIFERYGDTSVKYNYLCRFLNTARSDAAVRDRLGKFFDLFNENRVEHSLTTKHSLFSDELLRQIFERKKLSEGKGLFFVAQNICNLLIAIIENEGVDKTNTDYIMRLFTNKQLTRGDDERIEITKLIDKLDSDSKCNLMKLLVDKVNTVIRNKYPDMCKDKEENSTAYVLLAHIYAQSARVFAMYSILDPYKTDSIIREYCEAAKLIIETFNVGSKSLFHILGMCYLDRVKDDKDYADQLAQEKYDKDIQLIDDAIEYFQKTIELGDIEYGVPYVLKSVNYALQFIKNKHAIEGELSSCKKLFYTDEIQNYVKLGHEAIDSIEFISDDKIEGMRKANRERDEFYAIIENKDIDYAKRLQEINELLEKGERNGITDNIKICILRDKINIIEKKYNKKDRHDRYELLKTAYKCKDNSKVKDDVHKVYEALSEIVKCESYNPDTAFYIKWFDYAKYFDEKFSKCKQVADIWSSVELRRKNRKNEIWPAYYSFLIELLSYKRSNDKNSVRSAYEKLRSTWKRDVDRNDIVRIRDWYSVGTQMGKLRNSSTISYEDVVSESSLPKVEGKIKIFNDNHGYIEIVAPNEFDSWRSVNDNKRQLVFYNRHNAMMSKAVGDKVSFKLGFGFEGLGASEKSLSTFNIPKVKKVNDYGENSNAITYNSNIVFDEEARGDQNKEIKDQKLRVLADKKLWELEFPDISYAYDKCDYIEDHIYEGVVTKVFGDKMDVTIGRDTAEVDVSIKWTEVLSWRKSGMTAKDFEILKGKPIPIKYAVQDDGRTKWSISALWDNKAIDV